MKKYLYPFMVALMAISSFTFVSCSDDGDDNFGGKDNSTGSLIVNGEPWTYTYEYNGGDDPEVTGNYMGGVNEVAESVYTLSLSKTFIRPGEEPIKDRFTEMSLKFDRFYLEETPKGTDVTSYLTNASISSISTSSVGGPSWQGVIESGTITFEGLTDNDHCINIRFNGVTLKLTDKNGRYYDQTYTIDGIVRFARDDYWARPAFPIFELTLNLQPIEGSADGSWAIDQRPYEDHVIRTYFRSESFPSYRLSITINKTISDSRINAQLDECIGKNLIKEKGVYFTDGYSDIKYISGTASIENYKKTDYLFMHPDITFSFNDFTFKKGGKTYVVNGKARVVYDYVEY